MEAAALLQYRAKPCLTRYDHTKNSPLRGFTLAELLISLAILGVIATFTIPKLIQAQQNNKYKAIAKEAASMVSDAYTAYQGQNTASASTALKDLTPFMSYVKVDSTSTMDERPGAVGPLSCGNCLLLHNGALLNYTSDIKFNGTTTLNALNFKIDPNGKYDGTVSEQAISLWVYFNGRVTSIAFIEPNTAFYAGGTPQVRSASPDPSWFSWN